MATVDVSTTTAPKVSWLKRVGQAIAGAAKAVVGFLSSTQAQSIEQQAANLATILLPADAPIIQAFQGWVGKVFHQAVVTETQFANVTGSGAQKLAAVVAAVGPELDAWVQNNFPGSATVSADIKAGLVNAVVDLQNAITAPPAAPPAN